MLRECELVADTVNFCWIAIEEKSVSTSRLYSNNFFNMIE